MIDLTGRGAASIAVLIVAMALHACVGAPDRPQSRPYVSIPVPAPVFAGAVAPVTPAPPPVAPRALTSTIDQLVRNFDGLAGVAVSSVEDRWTTDANGAVPMPQQSVSKLWVAMTLLDRVDEGRTSLDETVIVRPEDLTLFHQPIASLVTADGYRTTLRSLLTRAMTTSDNTANDKLLWYVGGPDVVRSFIFRRGLGSIRFGPGERQLQAGTAGLTWRQSYAKPMAFQQARAALSQDVRRHAYAAYVASPPDGAAPASIATALARLKRGELLKPATTALLIGLMTDSRTGKARLRGAVPPGWSFGHKTGTGQDFSGRTAGYNDVGILTAPDGRSYGLAVMIGDSARTIPQKQAFMQAVVTAIVANHRR